MSSSLTQSWLLNLRSPHTRVRSTVTTSLTRRLTKAFKQPVEKIFRWHTWAPSRERAWRSRGRRTTVASHRQKGGPNNKDCTGVKCCLLVLLSLRLARARTEEISQLCHILQIVVEVADGVVCINTAVTLGAGVSEQNHWKRRTVTRRNSRQRKFRNGMFIPYFLGRAHQRVLDESSCLRPRQKHRVDL